VNTAHLRCSQVLTGLTDWLDQLHLLQIELERSAKQECDGLRCQLQRIRERVMVLSEKLGSLQAGEIYLNSIKVRPHAYVATAP
jgi:hypothetical protein